MILGHKLTILEYSISLKTNIREMATWAICGSCLRLGLLRCPPVPKISSPFLTTWVPKWSIIHDLLLHPYFDVDYSNIVMRSLGLSVTNNVNVIYYKSPLLQMFMKCFIK